LPPQKLHHDGGQIARHGLVAPLGPHVKLPQAPVLLTVRPAHHFILLLSRHLDEELLKFLAGNLVFLFPHRQLQAHGDHPQHAGESDAGVGIAQHGPLGRVGESRQQFLAKLGAQPVGGKVARETAPQDVEIPGHPRAGTQVGLAHVSLRLQLGPQQIEEFLEHRRFERTAATARSARVGRPLLPGHEVGHQLPTAG
jgi:hypothetical protein